jgi:predicted PurR-regulated permease PerM
MTTPLKNVVRRVSPADIESAPAVDLNARSIALFVLAASAAMAVLHWAQAVFIPIVLSILISYALDPIVRAIMRTRIPRAAASFLVVATLTGVFGYTGYALSDDATAVVATLPEAATKLRQTMRRGRGEGEQSPMQQVQSAAAELQRTTDEATGSNPAPRREHACDNTRAGNITVGA